MYSKASCSIFHLKEKLKNCKKGEDEATSCFLAVETAFPVVRRERREEREEEEQGRERPGREGEGGRREVREEEEMESSLWLV